ncbi:MAG: zinc ribbon domain-containing protein, partial [Acidimicrobiia bacterium]|nr:zinc ribbon domain-containing protein [Acidimicrobiia bacterium]
MRLRRRLDLPTPPRRQLAARPHRRRGTVLQVAHHDSHWIGRYARPVECAACGATNDAEARFCSSCGSQLALACPSCGHPNDGASNFCNRCGTGLRGETPPPATAPAEPREERRLATA